MGLVLFVDMDSFYASCEKLRHPELAGKPFAVGFTSVGDMKRGIVETASYEAKRLGIRSAMPVAQALRMKPDLAIIPSDHDYYDSVSSRIMEMLRSYGHPVEVMSVDEAAVDLGPIGPQAAVELGRRIKEKVAKEAGLPCTVGISTGKVLAKMVCDAAKPDGLKLVAQEDVLLFLSDKEVGKIPGVGAKTAAALNALGVLTVPDLAKADPQRLAERVGSFARELQSLANGTDNSRVVTSSKVSSISRERTLEREAKSAEEVCRMLDSLSDEVIVEVEKAGVEFSNVTVKAKYSDFTDRIKSKTLPAPSSSAAVLKATARSLAASLAGAKPIRKTGVRVSSFSSGKRQRKL